VDHIAVDNCANPNTTAQSVFEYQRVHDALVKVGKPMIFGIWNVGSGKPWTWAPQLGHYWRTGPDLGTKWEGRSVPEEGGNGSSLGDEMSIMLNFDLQQTIPSLDSISGPGSFALLDNLALGLPAGVPHRGDPGLSAVESETHMAIWCIMASE
jgi:alpha-galactosidase